MQMNSTLIRQSMGCGYEPPAPSTVDVMIPMPSGAGSDLGYQGEVTACPGYTATLPEVLEVDAIRAHWKVGAIVQACDGEQPSEQLLDALRIVDGQYNAAERYWTTPSKDGGGGS